MRAPLEFYSPQPEKGLEATTFAYLGAFEVNVQGERQTYLWLGLLPGAERHSAAPPAGATAAPNLRILIDGETLEPVPAGNRSALGVSIRPFKPPARWTQEYYFNVGLPELEKLAAAQSLLLELGPQGASPQRFEPWQDKSAELKRFVAELRGATP